MNRSVLILAAAGLGTCSVPAGAQMSGNMPGMSMPANKPAAAVAPKKKSAAKGAASAKTSPNSQGAQMDQCQACKCPG